MGLHRRFPKQTLVLLALFLSLPMFMNVDNGNCDVLVLALVLAAFYLDDGVWAGLLLGAAIAIKFSPLFVVLWFLANRRWRTAAWSVAGSGFVALAAWLRWGGEYFREFLQHLPRHGQTNMPLLHHTFESMQKIQNEVIVTPEGVFAYQHDIGGYLQNPLRFLGNIGGLVGIALAVGFLVWLIATRRGRGLSHEQSFFIFLVLWLLANPLLWTMGLVACFPLIVSLVDSSGTPNRTALLLLIPMFLTKQIVGEQNFAIWLVAAGFCLVKSGWLNQRVRDKSVQDLKMART
jgi:hypothetical protein